LNESSTAKPAMRSVVWRRSALFDSLQMVVTPALAPEPIDGLPEVKVDLARSGQGHDLPHPFDRLFQQSRRSRGLPGLRRIVEKSPSVTDLRETPVVPPRTFLRQVFFN